MFNWDETLRQIQDMLGGIAGLAYPRRAGGGGEGGQVCLDSIEHRPG